MKRPGVLHLVWTLHLAGAERVAQAVLSSCRAAGFEPHVCALSPSDPSHRNDWERKGIRVSEIWKRPGIDLLLPFRLRKLLRDARISILHTHNAVGAFYGGISAGADVLKVHTEHSNIAREKRMLRRFTAWQLRSASVVADSQKVAVMLKRRDGFPKEKIRLIYNGVATEFGGIMDRNAAKSSLGIPASARVVGTVGNLRPVKDQMALLSAFGSLAKEDSDLFLVIVGEGEMRSALEAEARRVGLEGRVKLPGYRSDAPRLFSAFDLFVLSSKSEGLPLALLEAMAAGRPCVATAVGGIPEVITDGENGRLVPPESPVGFARVMRQLLADPENAGRMGERGRWTVAERFSEKQMVEKYLELYRELS
ncbi:MAG: glycosyltransferase [Pseudomonadota bacterium]